MNDGWRGAGFLFLFCLLCYANSFEGSFEIGGSSSTTFGTSLDSSSIIGNIFNSTFDITRNYTGGGGSQFISSAIISNNRFSGDATINEIGTSGSGYTLYGTTILGNLFFASTLKIINSNSSNSRSLMYCCNISNNSIPYTSSGNLIIQNSGTSGDAIKQSSICGNSFSSILVESFASSGTLLLDCDINGNKCIDTDGYIGLYQYDSADMILENSTVSNNNVDGYIIFETSTSAAGSESIISSSSVNNNFAQGLEVINNGAANTNYLVSSSSISSNNVGYLNIVSEINGAYLLNDSVVNNNAVRTQMLIWNYPTTSTKPINDSSIIGNSAVHIRIGDINGNGLFDTSTISGNSCNILSIYGNSYNKFSTMSICNNVASTKIEFVPSLPMDVEFMGGAYIMFVGNSAASYSGVTFPANVVTWDELNI